MDKIYFKCRDGSLYTKYTKEEISDLINPFDFNTVKPFLKEMDYMAWEKQYFNLLEYSTLSHPKKIIYKYISWANLKVPKQFGYEDWELQNPKYKNEGE